MFRGSSSKSGSRLAPLARGPPLAKRFIRIFSSAGNERAQTKVKTKNKADAKARRHESAARENHLL